MTERYSSQGESGLSGSYPTGSCGSHYSGAAASSFSSCGACGTSSSAPPSAPVSSRISLNSFKASCGLTPKRLSALCTWHGPGCDARAHTPHCASMMVNSFEALGPPGKGLGSDAAAAARSAVRGCCVGERLMIWVGLGAGVDRKNLVGRGRCKKLGCYKIKE